MDNTIKFLKIFIFCIISSLKMNAQFWNLVWSDEFSSSTINSTNWTFESGASGWGNNELQHYTNRIDNAITQNGNLLIIAKKEAYQGSDYTSARMITKDKQSWKYGKIEARIKMPKTQGTWPAFWMLGANISQVSWPACGEIDIMEHVNTNNVTHGTMHWDINGHAYYGGDTLLGDVSQYHVYSIEWNAIGIKWFVDGHKFWSADIMNSINGTNEFHEPFFIILNMAIGGNWPGNPNSNFTKDTLFVDYVRVYENSTTPNSTNEIANEQTLNIYPNPVNQNQMLTIELKPADEVEIYLTDIFGKIHFSNKLSVRSRQNNLFQLDCKQFCSGVYILKVKNEFGEEQQKILIQ